MEELVVGSSLMRKEIALGPFVLDSSSLMSWIRYLETSILHVRGISSTMVRINCKKVPGVRIGKQCQA